MENYDVRFYRSSMEWNRRWGYYLNNNVCEWLEGMEFECLFFEEVIRLCILYFVNSFVNKENKWLFKVIYICLWECSDVRIMYI